MVPEPLPDPIQRLARSVTRFASRAYFAGAAVIAAAVALALPLLPDAVPLGTRVALGTVLVAFAIANLLAFRASASAAGSRPGEGAIVATGVAALGIVGAFALVLGEGLRSPIVALVAPIGLLVAGLVSAAPALWAAAACVALLAGLAAAEAQGLVAVPPGAAALPRLLVHEGIALALAFGGGRLLHWLHLRMLQAADERERHFRGLLAMAADGYWELDEHGRFTQVRDEASAGALASSWRNPIGRTPWELSHPAFDEHLLDALRADFELRQPFSGLVVRSTDQQGRPRHHSLSGRPRFDAQGQFAGYWGIVREVTAEVEADRALLASEKRWRELFTRSPSPLLLHRRGIILDANDAAARLFDLESAAACRGLDLLSMHADGDSRERAARLAEQLERTPVGGSAPVSDFALVSARGRRLAVQASSVRVDAPGGPATLSLWFDITARVAAETALRRSEALLTQLFATSPDIITLTERASGRYLLVNEAFTRITGWTKDEAVGRTSAELRIWAEPGERERLLDELQRRGRVDELPMTVRAKSGAAVSMLVSAATFSLDGREHLVINARDTTESDRVRNENAAMLRNASIGIAFTRDRRFVRVNPFFERMLGWPEGTLEGQPGGIVWPDESAYADVGRSIGPALAEGRAVEVERHVRRRDGSLFLCRVLAQALDPNNPQNGGTIWICEDVTERRQIEQALASARDAAEAASQAKSAFLANMSHEIRTPLNGMLGLARLARQPDLDAARRDQYLAQIADSAQGLSGIISDILDLAKIEAGKIRLESRPFDLRATIAAVHQGYHALAEAKGLAFTLHLADELPQHVSGDAVRLRQILSNYVTNAIKFTARGKVEIEAGLNEMGWIHLAVTDTGPGIDAATQKRLFAPFTQADDSTTRRFGGTGLGLSICRELAALMGGEVGLASEPGRGSRFWAALPLPLADTLPQWSDTTDIDPEILRGARVLLVEDNTVNMTVATAMLEQWGVEVVQATDGRAAIEAAVRCADEGHPVDLVLMDVQMPVMSGHEAARELRRRWDARTLPIVALTAAALVSEREQALAAGMNEFLTKPIDGARLRDALMRQLAAVA